MEFQNFKTLGNPLIIRKLTKNLKRFAPKVNEKNFAEILQGLLFGVKGRKNAFAA